MKEFLKTRTKSQWLILVFIAIPSAVGLFYSLRLARSLGTDVYITALILMILGIGTGFYIIKKLKW